MAEGLKVTIDREGCISCSLCWTTAPEFFAENPDDQKSQVIAQYRLNDDPAVGRAPADLSEAVEEAADSCPVEAITLD